MRRLARLFLVCALLAAGATGTVGAQTGAPSRSWATPQIKTVVSAGLMAPSVAEFRPDDPLLFGDLAEIIAGLGAPAPVVSDPNRLVTMRELDARLVAAEGLQPEARYLRREAIAAGLAPTGSLGTEAVARLLGLRINHPRDQEALERELSQPATRAEAAYSVARLLTISLSEIETVREEVDAFAFPALTPWEQTILKRALRFVGYPYVWAGTSEKTQRLDGKLEPGGFDCSGLVWRVYKLEPFLGAPSLAGVLKGRTTYAMSGEVARSERIAREDLQPADLVFFGAHGPRSKPAEVGHMGIYLGNGWIVHAYRSGVAIEPMVGWLDTTFAWGRRPLAEAGMS